MFVRSKVVKGHTYYQLVEGYRDGSGRVRHRTVASLGREPTIRDALDEALCQLSRVEAADGDVEKARARVEMLRSLLPGGGAPAVKPRWPAPQRSVLEKN